MRPADIQPGARVVRIGPGIGCLGVVQFDEYTAEQVEPNAPDGLKLAGIAQGLNARNFDW